MLLGQFNEVPARLTWRVIFIVDHGHLPDRVGGQVEPGHLVVVAGMGLGDDGAADVMGHHLAEYVVHGGLKKDLRFKAGCLKVGPQQIALGGAGEDQGEGLSGKQGQIDDRERRAGRCAVSLCQGMAAVHPQNQAFIVQMYPMRQECCCLM